jgi:colicin import membrane protein
MALLALQPQDALRPRADRRIGPGAALALLAHAGLIGALALGLNWRLPRQDASVSAELWAAVPLAAAPAALQVPPTTLPAPVPPAAKPPEPAPPPPVPAKPVVPPPPSAAELAAARAAEHAAEREAQIAVEKAAQRKKDQQAREAQAVKDAKDAKDAQAARDAAERERQRQAQDEAQRQKLKLEKKLEDKRLADDKAQAQKRDKLAKDEKAREDKRKQDLADQRERQQAEADAKVQDALVAKQREANLKRMLGQAGAVSGTGAANATGNAARDYAPSASYAGKIRKEIQANIFQTTEITGTPTTEVLVLCAPDGSITGRKITKPSGNPAWDETVLRAIDRTARLSRDVDGRIPPSFLLVMSPS